MTSSNYLADSEVDTDLTKIGTSPDNLKIELKQGESLGNESKVQLALNGSRNLVLRSIVSEEENKTPLYKLLLSDFHPFVTSRLQASHFVREGFITINGNPTDMPHHILARGDTVLASFDWRELFENRIERFYEAAEPIQGSTPSLFDQHSPPRVDDSVIESTQSKILVTWKPPGVSPLHVRESVFYREQLDKEFNTPEAVRDLFSDYFGNNPCDIKGTNLLYSVEKTSGGLVTRRITQC